jgi:hypothetical protein
VLLLQQRLPVLLHRRRIIHKTRQQLAVWGPWLAALHTLLGGLAAEACSSIAASRPVAAATVAAADIGSSAADAGSSDNAAGLVGADAAVEQAEATNGAAGEASNAAGEARPGSASKGSDAPNAGGSGRAASPPPAKKTTPRGSRAPTPRGKDGKDRGAAADALLSNEAIMQQLAVQASITGIGCSIVIAARATASLQCDVWPLMLSR